MSRLGGGARLPLSPDAPEVLDFYASRARSSSPPSSMARPPRSAGKQFGDGTPVHITIPTDNPWVPLRILGLGKQAEDRIFADVFLLTDGGPESCRGGKGLSLAYYGQATGLLLDDLRADRDGLGPGVGVADQASSDQLRRRPPIRPRCGRDGRGQPSLVRRVLLEAASPSSLPDRRPLGLRSRWLSSRPSAIALAFLASSSGIRRRVGDLARHDSSSRRICCCRGHAALRERLRRRRGASAEATIAIHFSRFVPESMRRAPASRDDHLT